MPEVLFVFQSFNKRSSVARLLKPFLKKNIKNILFFADGCIDGTASLAHSLLPGEAHYVVSCNDLHEIANYRLALRKASFLGCKYLVLLQDDDLYQPDKLISWVSDCIKICSESNICVIGGNGGGQIDIEFNYKKANSSISTASFSSGVDSSGRLFHQLGDCEKWFAADPCCKVLGNNCCYAAHVNRAPQFMDVSSAIRLNFFPKELEPYQYDDHWNCFAAWQAGQKVLLLPISEKNSLNLGGMRLYNKVSISSRPSFFADNWNQILDFYGASFSEIEEKVSNANNSLSSEFLL